MDLPCLRAYMHKEMCGVKSQVSGMSCTAGAAGSVPIQAMWHDQNKQAASMCEWVVILSNQCHIGMP